MIDPPPARLLAQILVEQFPGGLAVPGPGWTVTQGWPVFASSLPAEPANAVVISNTQGVQHGKLMRTGEVQEHYGVQILVRANNDDNVKVMARNIVQFLDAVTNRDVVYQAQTYRLFAATRTSSILDLPEEPEHGRKRVSVNYLLAVRKVS